MGRCPDIVLEAKNETLPVAEELLPLPMVQETCEYGLGMDSVLLRTRKKCRQLKASGSVSGGKIVFSVQTGTDTPRVFEFMNVEAFSLTEDLKKGDTITFAYQGENVSTDVTVIILKK